MDWWPPEPYPRPTGTNQSAEGGNVTFWPPNSSVSNQIQRPSDLHSHPSGSGRITAPPAALFLSLFLPLGQLGQDLSNRSMRAPDTAHRDMMSLEVRRSCGIRDSVLSAPFW